MYVGGPRGASGLVKWGSALRFPSDGSDSPLPVLIGQFRVQRSPPIPASDDESDRHETSSVALWEIDFEPTVAALRSSV